LSQSETLNPPVTNAHILIVDDDSEMRRTMSDVLIDAGFRITKAKNGVEALERCEAEAPDLIVTDVFMPQLDGIELIRKLYEKDIATRVLAISGREFSVDYLEIARSIGAIAILRKPFGATELLLKVNECLEQPAKPISEVWE